VNQPALLVAGHGSRDQASTRQFHLLLDRVRALAPELRVAGGFIELSPPPVPAAAADLIAAGHRDIVVVPLMLLAAGHVKGDIPALLARCRLQHPGVRFRYGRDLGLHSDLVALLDERLTAAVPEQERADTAVLLVGRGSSDPDANADEHKLARLLWEGRPWPLVEVAFAGITSPRVPEGLDRCRRLGARRVAVVAHLLFTGLLEQRIRTSTAAFAADHPEVDVRPAGYLGPDQRIAELVLARYREAIWGDPRMNCDLCVHRVALPGFHAKVGAPAVPHHHPDLDGHLDPHRHG
jgi:sirohydrochlorin cobaltochelatase